MPKPNDVHNIAPETVLEFLRRALPFRELEDGSLRELALHCIIDFMPKGTVIFHQGQTKVEHLYLIQKGGVKIYLEDDQGEITLKDFRGEGEYFGSLPIIQNTLANLNVETVEDTFCFLFTKDAFLHLLHTSPKVSHYFLRTLSKKLVNTAYAELRHHRLTPRNEKVLHLFSSRVGTSIKGKPKTIPANESVRQAAAIMAEFRIGSLMVTDPGKKIIGIVTDRDLRTKVVAAGLDYQTPVTQIMSSPVQTIPAHAVCFDAMLQMMKRRIHHLAVEKQGEIVGMITTHDIMLLQGTSPLYLFREIVDQRTLEGLHALARKVPTVVRSLIEEGAKANNITKMITVLNDHILERLLTLLIEELGPPPLPFCWLLMGSEGRSEQTFRTDQDNALLYQWPENEEIRTAAEKYFTLLSERTLENLVACGYPLCPGDTMASNPQWRMSLPTWKKQFETWINNPDPESVMHSSTFFDFRAGYGETALANELRHHIVKTLPVQEAFIHQLARNALEDRPPLSFFRNFIVDKDGEHRNTLDLKTKGLVPFVNFARLFALKHGIIESNTLARLQLLTEGGHLDREMHDETVQAYEFLMQLCLFHQMHLMEADQKPDNKINPANLSELEKQTLKESFEVVRRLQNYIKKEFNLSER